MVVKIDSLSFSSIYNNFIDYFNNQAQSEKWKDFYESSMGRMFMRLLSGFGAFISYMVTVARRENFLSYAQNRTSIIGVAQNLGYSVSRGKNEVISITVTPTITGFIPKFTVVGTVKDLSIVTVEELQLNKNVPTTIKVYLGNVGSDSITIDTDQLKTFRFLNSGVSDYVILQLNGSEVPFTSKLNDLTDDRYIMISNPLGSVDISYLQSGSYKYKSTDILSIQYIQLAKIDYALADISFDYGTVDTITKILPYTSAETNDSIKINAPIFHETQVLIRGREDYEKVFRSLGYNIADTGSRDFIPAIVDLTYVKNDYTIMSTDESTSILTSLDANRGMGIPLPRIINPSYRELKLHFNIKKMPNVIIPITDVTNDITSLTSVYEKTLKPSIDTELIEHNTEDYSYVKRARVSIVTSQRTNASQYRLGNFITTVASNNKIYQAVDLVRNSGLTEPSWSYNIGDLVYDNGIVWRCMNKYTKNPAKWYPNRLYKVGDLVKNVTDNSISIDYLFECIAIQYTSGNTKPVFSQTLGEFTDDDELIWVCKDEVENDIAWQSNTIYYLGDSIKDGSFSYECIGFRGTSASSEPIFKTTDNFNIIVSDTLNHKFTISGDARNFFRLNDVIRVLGSSGNDGYYTVSLVTYTGVNTEISVLETINSNVASGNVYSQDSLTVDGNILWKYYNTDDINFNFDWNNYIRVINTIQIS